MAEKAAHFSYSSQLRPSIFEVVAQDSLNATLQPAFRKLIEFVGEWNFKYLKWLCRYPDETFLALNGLLQYYYLKKHDASFSEYFYGLQRIPSVKENLKQRERVLSLVFVVVLPYLRRRLEDKLNIYKLELAEGQSNDWKSNGKKLLLLSNSCVEVSCTVWLLLNYLRYMSNEVDSQNPILSLLGLKLIYAEEDDVATSFWMDLFKGKLSFKEFGAGIVGNALKTSLEFGAFFVQFLQAWYKERSNYSITSLPVAAPPMVDPNANNFKGKCPICLQSWKIATVLPTSGYVFCFSCIVKHLREESRCPVTNYPVRIGDLVRLYD